MPGSFYGMFSVLQMFWLIFRSWETECDGGQTVWKLYTLPVVNSLSQLPGHHKTLPTSPIHNWIFWYWDVSSRKWGVADCPSDFLLPSKRSGLLKHPKEESDLILHRAIAQNGNSLNSHLSHCFQSMVTTLWTDSLFANSLLIIKK